MTENIPKIKEVSIKKFETPDGKQFNTELEALHHIKTLETKVYVLVKCVVSIGNSILIEGVYEDYETAIAQKDAMQRFSQSDVNYYVQEKDFFKKEINIGKFYTDNMPKINSGMIATISETSKAYVSTVGTKLQNFAEDATAIFTKK